MEIPPLDEMAKEFGVSSVVKDRLVELILLDPQLRLQLSKDRCRQIIQDIEQNGKRWSGQFSLARFCMCYPFIYLLRTRREQRSKGLEAMKVLARTQIHFFWLLAKACRRSPTQFDLQHVSKA